MNFPFRRKRNEKSDTSIADLTRMGELSDQMAATAEAFGRECATLQEAVKVVAAPAIEAFDIWEKASIEWLIYGDKFGLKERHDIRAALQAGRQSLAYFRSSDSQPVDWPDAIEEA